MPLSGGYVRSAAKWYSDGVRAGSISHIYFTFAD